MPYSDKGRHDLVGRGSVRTHRHGNWRQTYIDCAGMCVARVNGDDLPCGAVDFLELHEIWGENHNPETGKFQQRILLCNEHHAMVDGRAHQVELILGEYRLSRLQEDVQIEVLLAGGYYKWIAKYKLDDSRFASLAFSGPHIEDIGDA